MITTFDKSEALQFVAGLDIPEREGGLLRADEAPDLGFDAAKQQALVVGSDVISFDTGVEAEFREAVSDSALLAQLAATKQLGLKPDPIAYFDAYFAILGKLGWVTQIRDTAEYKVKASGAKVHQAILDVVSAFIGNVPGALKLVKLTLESLQSMEEDSKQIRLFERNTQNANIGHFQFTTVHQDASGGLFAEVMAFALDAEEKITKVLFFDLRKSKSRLRRSLGTMSLNRPALSAVLPAIRAKVTPHIAANVDTIEI
jgi:hypothetical protein